MTAPRSLHVLALIPELLTSVRVESAVQRLGGIVRVVETQGAFFDNILENPPDLAVIDLSAEFLDIPGIAETCAKRQIPAVAFARHTDAAVLREARKAGIGYVLPRGQFLEDLTGVLREALASGAETPT